MSMYECPYCEKGLGPYDVENVDGFWGDEDSQEREFDCPHCKRTIRVSIEVGASFEIEAADTVVVDGEEVPDMHVDMRDVMRHFRMSPQQVVVPDDVVCEVCGKKQAGRHRTALDYIKAGWRVASEYPAVRVTCPACYGGSHECAA
jgi:hypothetical protein